MRGLADPTVARPHKLEARAGFVAKRCLGRPATPLNRLRHLPGPGISCRFQQSFEAGQQFGLAGGLGQGGYRDPFSQDIMTVESADLGTLSSLVSDPPAAPLPAVPCLFAPLQASKPQQQQ